MARVLLARWAALLRPPGREAEALRVRNLGLLEDWTRRWGGAQAELRGPAAFFADPRYWEAEFAREAPGGHEWVGPPTPAMMASIEAAAQREGSRGGHSEVLHAGCGTSRLGPLLAQSWPRAVVHNTDISEAALEMARLACPSEVAERCRWRAADALDLAAAFGPLPRFAAVVDKGLVDSLLHGGATLAALYLQGAADLLAPGGVLVSVSDELNAEHRLDLLRAALHAEGAEPVSLRCSQHGDFAVYSARAPRQRPS